MYLGVVMQEAVSFCHLLRHDHGQTLLVTASASRASTIPYDKKGHHSVVIAQHFHFM